MATRGRTSLDDLGERLRLTREALSLTQVALCRRTGISTQAWNNYERGAKRISVDNAIKLRQRLGIPLDWIYCGDMRAVPLEVATKLQEFYETPQNQQKRA